MLDLITPRTSTGNMCPYAYSSKLNAKLTSDARPRQIGALFLRNRMRMDVGSQLHGSATVPRRESRRHLHKLLGGPRRSSGCCVVKKIYACTGNLVSYSS